MTRPSDEGQRHKLIREQAARTRTVVTENVDEVPVFGRCAAALGVVPGDLAMVLDAPDYMPFEFFVIYTPGVAEYEEADLLDVPTLGAFLAEGDDGKLGHLFPPRLLPDFWRDMAAGLEGEALLRSAMEDAPE